MQIQYQLASGKMKTQKTPATLASMRRRVGAVVGRMTKDEALATIAQINAEQAVTGPTIFSETIRGITGGFNSQSINHYVVRKIGVKAQIIKNYN